ncbi:hypothetical protein PIIN_10177 [Serendipita indica DSM 11827]|uniref:Uncharacterized protein n=1 Tax=Serendipita indica (strain DSM 11827) TaxID=1109443 RepID=G4TXZ1_SERID|nr:hypothetical protein PIIN_10177 [Serendipita indica DSM 11827]
MSLRTFATLKKKGKSKKTLPYARDPHLAYDRTRNNLLEGLKIAKAVTEATSFLGPMKAVCELGILFLETTKVRSDFALKAPPLARADCSMPKAVDENTSSLKEIHQRLSTHIGILDESIGTLPSETRGPAAIAEFQHAQQQYVA